MNQRIFAAAPQRLLPATDLSARCDRPLERARQLAAGWQAEQAILTVLEGPEVFVPADFSAAAGFAPATTAELFPGRDDAT